MAGLFTSILKLDLPSTVACTALGNKNRAFDITFQADGVIAFAQIIIRDNGREHLFNGPAITSDKKHRYTAQVPANLLTSGSYQVQCEGCKKSDIKNSSADDWIKLVGEITIAAPAGVAVVVKYNPQSPKSGATIYYGIHKHMHQPYYQAADRNYWDGQKDEIFGTRQGPYSHFIPGAVSQYITGGLPHGGLSTSFSGSLIEQLNRCEREGLCGGRFAGWKNPLRAMADKKTALGNQRGAFSAFGFFHPLMALIPARDIIAQIAWHRDCIKENFNVEASRILFPPETAFHVRMIPALKQAGIKAVIYDSIHRFRACKDYPYAGMNEGMLPPNGAEQENAPVGDWLQLQNIWAGSKISPQLLRPEYVKYLAVDGSTSKIIAVPAERYIGNEDARGGYGALQYGSVLGQVYDSIVASGSFDPKHPPFFILHSDGDNYGGGADSYYHHNTGAMVEWLKGDNRFELTTIEDYLQLFPPDESKAIHIEPGSWSGADNGDPQFRKWFSRYDQDYSPDLNSWAVLTALQNAVHSLLDGGCKGTPLEEAQRLMLTAETSCYWYWTGQDEWDAQVTRAANAAHNLIGADLSTLTGNGRDRTPPTIFAPWITPENPAGKTWGNNCLRDAEKQGTLHTFIADISGLKKAVVVVRSSQGEQQIPLQMHGPYPCRTGAAVPADYCTCQLPVGLGDVRYYIEAVDNKGNVGQSSLERIFLG